MQSITQINEGFVYLIVVLVGLVAWFSRLEFKTSQNAKDIAKSEKRQDGHEAKLSDLDNKVMTKLNTIENAVSRIEGSLNESSLRK